MLQAKINGIDYRAETDFDITDIAGNKSSSNITVIVDDQPIPRAGDIIELTDTITGDKLFYGTCGIPKSPTYQSIFTPKRYKIICSNANSILSYRFVNLAIQNRTVTYVVQTIFDRYIAEEGITLGRISDIPIIFERYTAADFNCKDALDEIAAQVNAVWQITNDKEFYFIVFDEFEKFPDTIDERYIKDKSTKLPVELQHATTDYYTRTVQIISGATDTTDPQTESFIFDGEVDSFTTVYPMAQKPTVAVNGKALNPTQIGVNGLDDQREGVIFSFSYNSSTLKYRKNSNYMKTGDVVTVTYVGIFNIRVVAVNVPRMQEIAKKTQTSGRREQVQLARNVTKTQDAINLANALLQEFEIERSEIKLTLNADELYNRGFTLDDTRVLTLFAFDLPMWGIVGDYVVTEQRLFPLKQDFTDKVERAFQIKLKLVDRGLMKSYGQIFADIQRDIQQLAIRGDDIVVDTYNIVETQQDTEQLRYLFDMIFYPVPGAGDYDLFSPPELGNDVYPV